MTSADAASALGSAPLILIGGVSGAGKSTVGSLLAAELGVIFVDGDDLHSPVNIAKMSSGVPLTDDDRAGWLDLIGNELASSNVTGVVIACSALKWKYREQIRVLQPRTTFVMLTPKFDVLRERVARRTGHFMSPQLLRSQLDALEPLRPGEIGIEVGDDIAAKQIVERVCVNLSGSGRAQVLPTTG